MPEKPTSSQVSSVEDLEREKIQLTIGSIGGKPRLKGKILNAVFVVGVLGAFAASMLTSGISRIISIDVGVLLLSLKFAYHLHTEAKVNHAQFWILTTIEDRLLNIITELRVIKRELRDSLSSVGDCPLTGTPGKEPADPSEEE